MPGRFHPAGKNMQSVVAPDFMVLFTLYMISLGLISNLASNLFVKS